MKFYCRPGDLGQWDESIVSGCLKGMYGDGFTGTVIDIGAHIGGFSILAAQTAERVIAFEASTANYEMLLRNIEVNGLANIEARHLAVVGDGKPVSLFVNSQNSGRNSVFSIGQDHAGAEMVEGITLEAILDEVDEVDFLKSDCEGAEYGFFFATPVEKLRKIKKMGIEAHTCETATFEDLISFLSCAGFSVSMSPSLAASARMLFIERV